MKSYSLRHLQEHLPWSIAYSAEFEASAEVNPLRRVEHDILHVIKSLGRVAAECEASDHGKARELVNGALAKEVADLVICALHIAHLEGFDLNNAVVESLEERNKEKIPPEPQEIVYDNCTGADMTAERAMRELRGD